MPSPKRPKAKGCERCNYEGLVFSNTLAKWIRCPYCSPQKRVDTRRVMQELTAAEQRRSDQVLQRAALTLAREAFIVAQLPNDLLTTDRILQRWAVGHGSGLPFSDDELDEMAKEAQEHSDTFAEEQSKPPTLDSNTQTVIDQIIGPDPDRGRPVRLLETDPRMLARQRLREERYVTRTTARFVWQWYCQPIPCRVMSEQRAMDEATLYVTWYVELGHVRARFMASDHEDLIALVRMVA